MIPTLQTARLRLRAPALSDFPASQALWTDPVVTRFISTATSSREGIWARLLRYVGHWHLLGYGYWIVETQDGRHVGEVGFGDFHRDITPGFDGIPEIGWVLSPAHHGQGFATEAAQAAMAWRTTSLAPGPTVCIIGPENTASLGVAAKLGFSVVADTVYHGKPTRVLRHEMPLASPAGASNILG